MFSELAARIVRDLERGIEGRGEAVLVVSGGTTPGPLFDALADADLDWERVSITLADERWVEPDDHRANEWLVRSKLLKNRAARARFIGLKQDAATPDLGERLCHNALSVLPRPFDVAVLGMGEDGHTASLFPGAVGLARALSLDPAESLCAAIAPSFGPPARMTLTLPVLRECGELMILCTGQAKMDTLKKALDEGPIEEAPVRAFLKKSAQSVSIYWSP